MKPLSVALHHGEPGDPDLFEWIMHRLDALISLEPAAIVAVLGLVVVIIPAAILVAYAIYRRRAAG